MNAASRQLELFAMLGVLALVGLAYSPVVTNAFNGDDFVHLNWLHQAISQPELIWRNFHSSWLDLTTAKFYRPLISLFMVADYIIWHNNGVGFHLTNLICHLLNTLLVWLIIKNIVEHQFPDSPNKHYAWSMSAAGLFGLYPLHVEAVSWITGRVDVIVTLFFLAAFFFYLRFRKENKYGWLVLSAVSFSASLLSKEMAIVLPATLFAYEFVFEYSENKQLVSALKNAFRHTSIYWALLFAYFVLRFYALGTVIGGYDNTNLAISDWHLWRSLWTHSLYMLLVPFNQNIVMHPKAVAILWELILVLGIFLSMQLCRIRKERAIFIFLFCWLMLSLLPVYKIFNILPDLQGSRLAYLATVPLSMLICFGLANYKFSGNTISGWQLMLLAVIVSVAGAGLAANNLAWMKAESISHVIVQQLNEVSKKTGVYSIVYIVGLPDQINGAYICRNALAGMTKYPQISQDIHNCFDLNEIDHVFPSGYALNCMSSANPFQQFYAWNQASQTLDRIEAPKQQGFENSWIGGDSDSNLAAGLKGKSCMDVDFIYVSTNSSLRTGGDEPRPYMIYKNDLHPEGIHIDALPVNKEGGYLLPLHSLVDWKLGGKCAQIGLHSNSAITSVSVVPANKIMPILHFNYAPNQNPIGYIELDQTHSSCDLTYDAGKIKDAKTVALEFSSPNALFAVPNDPSRDFPLSPRKQLPGLIGKISLTKADFPEPSIYAIRLRAIDKDNKCTGVAGDHIIITVR